MTSHRKETSVTVQDVDRESKKCKKSGKGSPGRAIALLVPNFKLKSGMRSTGTSMDVFVRGMGLKLTHTEKLSLIKKPKIEEKQVTWRQKQMKALGNQT